MRIAIPIFSSYVAPRLDCADIFWIIEVVSGKINSQETWVCDTSSQLARIRSLAELNVDMIICGAIDNCSCRLLAASGKRVIPWQGGEVNEVMQRYLSDQVKTRNKRCSNHRRCNCLKRSIEFDED